MTLRTMAERIKAGEADRLFLDRKNMEEIGGYSVERIESSLRGLTKVPMEREGMVGRELLRIYYTYRWGEVMRHLCLRRDSTVLELASGSQDMVPQALETFSSGQARYLAANLNKMLTAELTERMSRLRIGKRIIEDDAINLSLYLEKESVDLVAFNHAINDILEHIVAKRNKKDTINIDFWQHFHELINDLVTVEKEGKLKEVVFEEFIEVITVVHQLLKPGGFMVFNNYFFEETFYKNTDHETTLRLYSSFIDLVREWISESDIPLVGVELNEFDPQWWLFLRKDRNKT